MSKLKNYGKSFMEEFKRNDISLLASAQAYHYLLSIVPLLIVCFALIPYLHIQPDDAISFISKVLPSEMGNIFKENIISLVENRQGGLLTVGIIGALWSASNGINSFIKSTNKAYEVEETRSFITVRLTALTMTLLMIASLVVAIVLPIFGNVIYEFIASEIGFASSLKIVFNIFRWGASFVVLTLLLMLFYRIAPNTKLPFKHILPGTVIAGLLWLIVSAGFSLYVSNFGSYSVTYGSLGGIIILMIWFFLTAFILMIGALINVLYHKQQQQHKKAA
ncbi:YihY/virulence factor BrkB family protein [Virgibacillus sp. 179-BFC.A HS]|uniref:YihY/virulence factor BrkB family protein n=1 Tax=Tigheibacillus jepli TaxID=3035914 RepID=A0ABU5CLJ4_9BACI|nr:YihY/virulence factor BrkB family protein [Virgibacillus sp. 179-BFC.A HS]MDY0407242.1 YihY/virulence factor BrkB family protein [Virgibacillus sp. 179-BFC.A HS]